MSADKYPSIFSRQMKAIYLFLYSILVILVIDDSKKFKKSIRMINYNTWVYLCA